MSAIEPEEAAAPPPKAKPLAKDLAEATVCFVDYLDAAQREVIPPAALRTAWPAEEACVPLAERLADATLPDAPAAALMVRAQAFLDGILLVLRRSVFPEGPLEDFVFVGPTPELHLIAETAEWKVRADEALRVAIVRRSPVSTLPPRQGSLRHELRTVLAFPLVTPQKRALAMTVVKDLSAEASGAIYVELEPPASSGFVGGRFESLHVYSDGRVCLIGWRPVEYRDLNKPVEPAEAARAAAAFSARPKTLDDLLAEEIGR